MQHKCNFLTIIPPKSAKSVFARGHWSLTPLHPTVPVGAAGARLLSFPKMYGNTETGEETADRMDLRQSTSTRRDDGGAALMWRYPVSHAPKLGEQHHCSHFHGQGASGADVGSSGGGLDTKCAGCL